MFKKICSILIVLSLTMSLLNIPLVIEGVHAEAQAYPLNGYCTQFKTDFNYDKQKVPNYPFSAYLDGITDPNDPR